MRTNDGSGRTGLLGASQTGNAFGPGGNFAGITRRHGMNTFPFTAVVGMELAKKSLIYHAIDPRIGGALFLGHRGCAKSTLVRGFAEILAAATKDRAPFVELPLGTTEDRLLGSVNAEMLVDQGKWQGR